VPDEEIAIAPEPNRAVGQQHARAGALLEEAAELGFCGSPTIRVGGADPLPPPPGEPTGLTCRVYWTAAGRPSPTPDPDLLRAALARLIGTHTEEPTA
jgi:hypothetical protein